MERTTDLKDAKRILGSNLIGPEELIKIKMKMPIADPQGYRSVPRIPYSQSFLRKLKRDYLLVLGVPNGRGGGGLTLCHLRDFFGIDPTISQPCFYNQDWYLKERFANTTTLKYKWYLIGKKIIKHSRGQLPEKICKSFGVDENFPQAILTAYTFFAYYFLSGGKILWKHDFIWCQDEDGNKDVVYTGRYFDPKGLNKNGFNIHRYLSIRPCYGYVRSYRAYTKTVRL